MKKLLGMTFVSIVLLSGLQLHAGRGGDSFAGGMAGGMFGGLIGGSIASSANRSSGDDGGSFRRAISKVYDEIDRLREAVKSDLEGLNNKLDDAWSQIKEIKKQMKKQQKHVEGEA